jgi:uncharacterized protein
MAVIQRSKPTLIDTNAILALLDRKDSNHESVKTVFPAQLLVPSTVLPEVDYLATTRLGSHVAQRFLKSVLDGELDLIQVESSDLRRALELQLQYADVPLGLVDTSIVALAERLQLRRVLTFDRRHFRLVKPVGLGHLELLP